ncbi:MAG: FAD-dependent oxidoreductase [Candidatus Heimdallarchaeota archaeon]|nr:FAD-dependent oxidoreductase [Candidatus Heimdallarchaeota archaeon]MCG3257479.1 FAD-dependent oxidoreductase [Candidatus Heimdallarchaeota archaeon]MCK4612532.1 FAD-dependent oxidoreductase [Candidatus Heimdallarchaeota archaeon]
MSEKHYDVVVIGAGLFGIATAYHIKKENENLAVLVIDKAAQVGAGNTAKPAALYYNQEHAELHWGTKFKVSRLGLEDKNVDKEGFVI